MSEEEEKAVEYYKNNEYTFGFETDMDLDNLKKALGIEETDEDTFEKHQIRFKTLLNLIEKLQKELEQEKKKREIAEENYKGLSLDLGDALKELGLPEDTIIADELVLKINNRYISKDKIRAETDKICENHKIYEEYFVVRKVIDILEELLEE